MEFTVEIFSQKTLTLGVLSYNYGNFRGHVKWCKTQICFASVGNRCVFVVLHSEAMVRAHQVIVMLRWTFSPNLSRVVRKHVLRHGIFLLNYFACCFPARSASTDDIFFPILETAMTILVCVRNTGCIIRQR